MSDETKDFEQEVADDDALSAAEQAYLDSITIPEGGGTPPLSEGVGGRLSSATSVCSSPAPFGG
jgi:hypothetical protein